MLIDLGGIAEVMIVCGTLDPRVRYVVKWTAESVCVGVYETLVTHTPDPKLTTEDWSRVLTTSKGHVNTAPTVPANLHITRIKNQI